MKAKVITAHLGEGTFPDFPQGTKVTITGDECSDFRHWYPCEIDGYQTYIPKHFFAEEVLTRDYNPTELIQAEGDIITVEEIAYAWLRATNEKGQTGWIPAQSVVSL